MAKKYWDLDGKVVSATAITPQAPGTTQEYDALYVGTGGNLKVIHVEDTVAVEYLNVGDGELFPFAVKEVQSGGTATVASAIIGLHTSKKPT